LRPDCRISINNSLHTTECQPSDTNDQSATEQRWGQRPRRVVVQDGVGAQEAAAAGEASADGIPGLSKLKGSIRQTKRLLAKVCSG
jgi:hypothetical protein